MVWSKEMRESDVSLKWLEVISLLVVLMCYSLIPLQWKHPEVDLFQNQRKCWTEGSITSPTSRQINIWIRGKSGHFNDFPTTLNKYMSFYMFLPLHHFLTPRTFFFSFYLKNSMGFLSLTSLSIYIYFTDTSILSVGSLILKN